ncbi:MAG: phosphoribosylamine--glycine ligase [Chitinophagaceae bacterium]
MNILLLGSGGREHALATKMLTSHHCNKLFVAPGNAGTATITTNVELGINDFDSIKNFCVSNKIDLLVVGPEEPLVNGIYDALKEADELKNMIIVAPSKAASQLEGSKDFAKQFMQKHHIPTANYATFDSSNFLEGKQYISYQTLPIVLKADGLAAGKGVVICNTHEEALEVFESMIMQQQFGKASERVVVEEFLEGIELSVFVLTNGYDYQIIGHAKDYKQIGEGNKGLNTGGMGCVSPVPFVNDAFMDLVDKTIIKPTINGLQTDGLIYNGFIFFGLMNCNGIPKVIEYNCRLGDPETEVVLPRLETDLVSLFAAMDNGTLIDANIEFNEGNFATVVTVSGGYPNDYKKNIPIYGIENLQHANSTIYFAGVSSKADNSLQTNGGRVFAITSVAATLQDAVEKSNAIAHQINYEGKYFRRDIGFEFF